MRAGCLAIGITAALATAGVVLVLQRESPRSLPRIASRPALRRTKGVDPHNAKAVAGFIARHAQTRDKHVQDQVARARIALAYDQALHKNLPAARQTLLVAEKQYRGTGDSSADWGSLSDQAAYQAAVVLVAEHKPAEARAEFIRFLKDRPLSPLAKVVYRRLERLNGGKPDLEAQRLTQADISKQEARIRFEESVCGPRALEYLLPKLGKPAMDYRQIAKLCGTSDQGTSIDGMRTALKHLGVESYAFRLNRRDLAHAPLPAIYLRFEHYFVLERVNADSADVYDPVRREHANVELPPLDDPNLTADVILFSPPLLSNS